MSDPLRQPGAANVGAGALSRGANGRWELGVVVLYNSATHTSMVRTHSGRPLRDVPQIKGTSGGYDHLETGTTVVISWDLGIPAIVGCMDFTGLQQAAIAPPSLTGVEGYGDADPTQATQGGNSYKPPTAPTDMSPGDWAQVGGAGNHVAVLAGGVTLMGSPTAQVQSFGLSGTLKSVARRIQAISDFGRWGTENDQGKTSFVLRAGSSQSTQTGLDEQNWTINLDLGATGDVLDFSIADPVGRTLFRLHAGSDGRVQLFGDGGVDVSSGTGGTAETRNDVAGSRSSTVVENDDLAVQGDATAVVDGADSRQVGGDSSTVVGGSASTFVGGDSALTIGGDDARVTAGSTSVTMGKSLTAAVADDVTATVAGRLTATVVGNATIASQQTATLSGRSVVLGTRGLHPLPQFDVFLVDLGNFLTNLTTALGAVVASDPATLASMVALIQAFGAQVASGAPYESQVVRND